MILTLDQDGQDG